MGVVPDARNFNNEMRKQLFPEADNVGREYGAKLGRGIQEAVRVSIERIKADLEKEGFKANVDADATKARDEIDTMRAEQEARPVKLKVEVDRNSVRSFGAQMASRFSKFSRTSFIQPSAIGTALALSPSLIPLSASIAAGIGAIAVSFGAAIVGAGLFGLLAKSALTQAGTAAAAVKKAQETYNIAIASGVKQSTAYATEQKAIATAYRDMSPAQIALSKQVGLLANKWDQVKKSLEPVIAGALVPWLKAAGQAMQFLRPLVTPIAAVFKDWGQSLQRYFSNTIVAEQLRQLAESFGKFSASQLRDIGSFLVNIGAAIFHLGTDLAANGVNFGAFGDHLKAWGKAFDTWSKSAKARADVQGFLHYLHTEGPVVSSILSSLGKILPGIFAGASITGTLELKAISQFLGFIAGLPKGWQAPLTEAAGALLLLSKTGTIKVGLKLAGALADHPRLLGFSIGTLLAAGIIDAVNQKRPGHGSQTWWQSFGPPSKGQQQTWLNSWSGLGDRIVQIADDVRHGVARAWDLLWNNTGARTRRGAHDISVEFNIWRHNTSSIFDNVRHDISSAWDTIWNNTIARARRGISDVLNLLGGLPGKIKSIFAKAGTWLLQAGKDVIQGFWNGLKFIWGKVTSFISGIASWIKAHKGPVSLDARLLEPAGRALMTGLLRGLVGGFGGIAGFIGGVAGKIAGLFGGGGGGFGAGAMVAQAFARSLFSAHGWSMAQWPFLLALWNQESGWNASARNPSSGAAGIPQDITGNFHGGYKGQVIWGENYIAGRYGSPAAAWAHERAFNWYDSGGWWMPGDWGINTTTQPEPVLTPGQWDAIYSAASKGGDGGGVTYVANFDGLTAQVIQTHVRQSFQEMEIGKGKLARMGRRS